MFDEVHKMVCLAQMQALNHATKVPMHSIRQIRLGNRNVQYSHVEKLHTFFYGEKK